MNISALNTGTQSIFRILRTLSTTLDLNQRYFCSLIDKSLCKIQNVNLNDLYTITKPTDMVRDERANGGWNIMNGKRGKEWSWELNGFGVVGVGGCCVGSCGGILCCEGKVRVSITCFDTDHMK